MIKKKNGKRAEYESSKFYTLLSQKKFIAK